MYAVFKHLLVFESGMAYVQLLCSISLKMFSKSSLFQIILKVAIQENKCLKNEFGKGIFFMPELAFSYLCGKSIMTSDSVTGNLQYNWVREKEFKNYGFADLVLEPTNGGPEAVIEFKMDSTYHNYVADANKLRLLKGNYIKFFCGLKWVYADQVDEFMEILRRELRSELVDYKDFETIVHGNKRGDRCLLSLWEIKNE